jgi:hypothetical protein
MRAGKRWQARAALASAPVAREALSDPQALQWAEKHGLQWALKYPDDIRAVIADAQRIAAPQASEGNCSCPSGDGSLRHPCAVHPTNHQQPAGDAKAWFDLFWSVAKELNCLPSSFVDGNEHVLRAARQARVALAALPSNN